jgi:beta-phosphoglucomutase-like phosphatase (HAD superfamily)
MRTLFILDIDGTLANAADRFQRAGHEPSRSDRAAYSSWLHRVQSEATLAMDKPVPGMAPLVLSLAASDDAIAYVTSREEKYRAVTEAWLLKNHFPQHRQLYMRGADDWRSSGELKEAIIKILAVPYDAVVVVDDDPLGDVQSMCSRNGYTFLKACSGGEG